jgi:hypothetical protein
MPEAPMSRTLPLLLLLAAAWPAAVLATGFGGDSPPTRIPVPAREFKATVEDRAGAVVQLTRVTLNGEIFFSGVVGEGQVSVPFDTLAEVRIEPSGDDKKVVALVKLHDGASVRMTLDYDVPFYGDAVFGHYKIEIEKVRKLTFPPPG